MLLQTITKTATSFFLFAVFRIKFRGFTVIAMLFHLSLFYMKFPQRLEWEKASNSAGICR